MIPGSLVADLSEICGSDGVIVDEDRLLAYESDALTAYRHRPGAVLLPRTTEEVCEVVGAVSKHGLSIVPRGAGTGLSGGAVALGGAVVIGTARMNRILKIDPRNRRAVLQPGVINAELSAAVAPYGLYYAPDPSSQTACTIGGNVAENSGGPHCLKYGVTSRYVTGLKVVLSNGSVVELGGRRREPPGYDLVGLFVGSEGCFGIATEIEVSLLPLPEGVRTVLAIFDRIDAAGRAVSAIVGAGLLPAAMEIIDGATIRAVEDSVFAAGYPTDAEAALVIEFDGVEAGLDREAARAGDLCERAGARGVRRARSEEERAALWKGRKKAFGAMGRIAPDLLVQDATVPRTTLPAVLRGISRIGKRYELVVANVFHAGDGNLHPNILFDRRNKDELARVEQASKEIMRLCIDAGGTITGEHGVGLDKKHHMSLVYGPEELSVMWSVRRAFDPDGVLNPGKVLPEDTDPGRNGSGDSPAVSSSEGAAIGPPASGDEKHAPGPSGPSRENPIAEVVGLLSDNQVLLGGAAREWSGGFPADVVAFPASVEEVRALVLAANKAKIRIIPAGRGSWLTAGGWGRRAQVVISTLRLNSVQHYEPADLTLTAGAGLLWRDLVKVLAPNEQWLPVDPPGRNRGALGALVASGVSGPLEARYGAVRDNVLGLEVVTGDGRILRIGGRVVKNVAGYDLVRAMTGSRGSLGIVTGVSVRLFPLPEAQATLFFSARGGAGGGDGGELVTMAQTVCTSPLPVVSADLIEGGCGPSGVGMTLAVQISGGWEEMDDLCSRVSSAAGSGPASVLRDAESEAFHDQRTDWEDGSPLVIRLSALPALLADTFDRARALAADLHGEVTAHAQKGTVRVKAPAPDALAEWGSRLLQERREMEKSGGSLTLTRGPGELAARAGWTGGLGSEGQLTRRIKALFDPMSVLSGLCPDVSAPDLEPRPNAR